MEVVEMVLVLADAAAAAAAAAADTIGSFGVSVYHN